MMTLRKSSVFPATEQEIYLKLQKLKTLLKLDGKLCLCICGRFAFIYIGKRSG